MAYGELQSEGELETISKDKVPPVEWPDKGVIRLHNVKFKYAVNYPYVLKSVSFKIESCEKVSHCISITPVLLLSFNRLALWVGLELASLLCCQHCSD